MQRIRFRKDSLHDFIFLIDTIDKIDTIDNKLDKSFGSSEANKMVITDASGNIVTAEAGSMAVLVDNLDSTSTTMALAANQGRVLNNKKLDKQLGVENAGKFLKVNDDGVVGLGEVELENVVSYEDSVTVQVQINELLEKIYPVGSIYMSMNGVSPQSFLGGVWVRIKDTFLLSAGDIYSAGSMGGEAEHTLTENEMPSHRHNFIGSNGFSNDSASLYKSGSQYTEQASLSKGAGYSSSGTLQLSHVGGGVAHNNMPPYLVVHVWYRYS